MTFAQKLSRVGSLSYPYLVRISTLGATGKVTTSVGWVVKKVRIDEGLTLTIITCNDTLSETHTTGSHWNENRPLEK
jgi:hypothetical protein